MIKFNGPARANNPVHLSSDLKIIRVMIKSGFTHSERSGKAGDQSNSNNHNNQNSNIVVSHPPGVTSAMSVEVLQQLPNTVSVSFKGIRSYEIIEALSDKVRFYYMFTLLYSI